MAKRKKMKARDELITIAAVLVAAFIAWYVVLYSPVTGEIKSIHVAIASDNDSLAAIDQYEKLAFSYDLRTEQLHKEIESWDKGFPPRSTLVTLAKEIISFSHNQELQLLEMQPSLFELYALENYGNKIAGRFLQKQLFRVKLQGRYLNFGRMLQHIDKLPFNVTVTDIAVTAVPNKSPLVNIDMSLFLYVHQ